MKRLLQLMLKTAVFQGMAIIAALAFITHDVACPLLEKISANQVGENNQTEEVDYKSQLKTIFTGTPKFYSLEIIALF